MLKHIPTLILLSLIVLLSFRIWTGHNSLAELQDLEQQIIAQQAKNLALEQQNAELRAWINELKSNPQQTAEELARERLGLVKPSETLFWIDQPEKQRP